MANPYAVAALVTVSILGLPGCAAAQKQPAAAAPAASAHREVAGHVLETQVPFQKWTPLPGHKLGLLVAVEGRWGRLIGWGKMLPDAGATAPGPARNYWFLTDGDSARALYFESHGEGHNFLQKWNVPLADGTQTHYDAAMFGPGVPNRFGLGKDAHLVDLEVNGGRGSPGNYIHFVATGVALQPLDLDDALARAAAEFHRFVDAQRAATEAALREVGGRAGPPLGPERSGAQEGLFPTWSSSDGHLHVLFVRHETRTSSHTEMHHVSYPCTKYQERVPARGGGGPDAPLQFPGGSLYRCPPPHDEPTTVSKSYGVELAAAYEFDGSGKLIAVTEYLPGALPLATPAPP